MPEEYSLPKSTVVLVLRLTGRAIVVKQIGNLRMKKNAFLPSSSLVDPRLGSLGGGFESPTTQKAVLLFYFSFLELVGRLIEAGDDRKNMKFAG